MNCQNGQEMCGIVITQDSLCFLHLNPGLCQCIYVFAGVCVWVCVRMLAVDRTSECTHTDRDQPFLQCDVIQWYTWKGCETLKHVRVCDCVCVCIMSVCETAAPYKATGRYQPLLHRVEIMQKRCIWAKERNFLSDVLSVCMSWKNWREAHGPYLSTCQGPYLKMCINKKYLTHKVSFPFTLAEKISPFFSIFMTDYHFRVV